MRQSEQFYWIANIYFAAVIILEHWVWQGFAMIFIMLLLTILQRLREKKELEQTKNLVKKLFGGK